MKLEFKCMIMDADWLYLKNNDIDSIIWTHYEAIQWLDDLNYYCEYREELVDQWAEWHITLTYAIDAHTLDFLMLKWPRLFETRAAYESVKILT